MSGRFLIVAVGLFAVACSGSPQVVVPSPTPSTPAAQAPTSSGSWRVTIQTISDAGTSFCIHQPSVGSTFHADYQLVWNGDTVMFVPPDPIDWDSFTANVSGLHFVAATPPTGSGVGMCTHYVQASSLIGSFSDDYVSFTATATWSFTLDSGQVETITFSWVGTRRG
jgi:hypothetical protein